MATGPNQKNPSKKERQNQNSGNKTPYAQSLIERVMNLFENARQAGNAANEARYRQILSLYDRLTDEQKADLDTLNTKHSDLAENIANMSGDVLSNMKGVADGTIKDVLTGGEQRVGDVSDRYRADESRLGQLAQQAEGRVGELGDAARQRAEDRGEQVAGQLGEMGQAAREGVTGRGEQSLQDLLGKYQGATDQTAQTNLEGRAQIQQGYQGLGQADAERRAAARGEVGSDFAGQEAAAGRRFDQARQDIGQDTAAGVSETGQRFAGGREDVRGEFGRARQTAQGISAGAEQRAGQLGQQTLQDLSARAEGRLGKLGQGYSELGQQATGQAAATGQDIGGRFDALRGQAAQGIRGAIDETGQAFGAGRADVTGGFQGAQAERAGRYDARTQQGLNMYDQMGQASMDRINRQFDEQIERTVGQMEQNLVSRGLDNTTIRGQIDRARSDIERNRQEAIGQVESQVRQQKAGAFERFTSQGMSAQDAMQAAGLSAGAQMTGQQLAAQQQLRGAGVQSDIGLGQAGIGARERAAGRGEQAGLQTGLAGLAQQAQGQQAISAAEQAVGRQTLAGQLGAVQQGTQAQMGLLGQGAGAAAGMTGQGLAAQQQMAAQGLGAQSNLAGARAGAQQQAGMAGVGATTQMRGQELGAATGLGQAGLAAQERGQTALEGQTQQSRLAGLSALAAGQQQQRGVDASMAGQQFGAQAGALAAGQQQQAALEGQALGARAGMIGQGFGQQAGMIGQGAGAFQQGQSQLTGLQGQLAGQGMAAQFGQQAQGFGTQAQLGQGAVSALERGQQRGDVTKQNTLDFMERKTEDVPSLDQYAGLALAAGQSGMGVGGGGMPVGAQQQQQNQGFNPWAMQQIAAQQKFMRDQMVKQREQERADRVKANEERRADRTAAKKELNERLAAERKVAEENRAKLEETWNKANEERIKQQEKFDKKHAKQVEKYEQAMAEGRERDAENHQKTISKLEANWNQTNNAFANAMQGLVDAQQNTPPGQPIDLDITVNGQLVDAQTGVQPIDPNKPTGGPATQGPGNTSTQGGGDAENQSGQNTGNTGPFGTPDDPTGGGLQHIDDESPVKRPPTQPPTQSPTQPPTQSPTQPPTQSPNQSPTQPPTQPPTIPPPNIPTTQSPPPNWPPQPPQPGGPVQGPNDGPVRNPTIPRPPVDRGPMPSDPAADRQIMMAPGVTLQDVDSNAQNYQDFMASQLLGGMTQADLTADMPPMQRRNPLDTDIEYEQPGPTQIPQPEQRGPQGSPFDQDTRGRDGQFPTMEQQLDNSMQGMFGQQMGSSLQKLSAQAQGASSPQTREANSRTDGTYGGPSPSMHGSIAAPQGGGQPQSSVTGPSREEFWEQKYAESAARKQQDQERRDTESKRFEQTRNEVNARSRQAFLDNMQRRFDIMTPQQRMQNADNFQRDMDRWQSRYGEGGNTRSQGELFNRIADGIGSNQGRQFQLNERPQASRMQQGPQQKQELPMFGQEGYGEMIRQRRAEQGGPKTLADLRNQAQGGMRQPPSMNTTSSSDISKPSGMQANPSPQLPNQDQPQMARFRRDPQGSARDSYGNRMSRIPQQNRPSSPKPTGPTTVNLRTPNQGVKQQFTDRQNRALGNTMQTTSQRANQMRNAASRYSRAGLRTTANRAKPRTSLPQLYGN